MLRLGHGAVQQSAAIVQRHHCRERAGPGRAIQRRVQRKRALGNVDMVRRGGQDGTHPHYKTARAKGSVRKTMLW